MLDKKVLKKQWAKTLKSNNISGWKIRFEELNSQYAITNFTEKEIVVDTGFVDCNEFDVVNRIFLHEIAHVLAGFKAMHNKKFRTIAKKLGGIHEAAPNTDKYKINLPISKYYVDKVRFEVEGKIYELNKGDCFADCEGKQYEFLYHDTKSKKYKFIVKLNDKIYRYLPQEVHLESIESVGE
jgi:hypothetical protein